jgi:hypothetical protein
LKNIQFINEFEKIINELNLTTDMKINDDLQQKFIHIDTMLQSLPPQQIIQIIMYLHLITIRNNLSKIKT